MIIATKFDFGQMVYLITDEEQKQYMITSIRLEGPLCISYYLVNGRYSDWHHECSICDTIDVSKKIKSM